MRNLNGKLQIFIQVLMLNGKMFDFNLLFGELLKKNNDKEAIRVFHSGNERKWYLSIELLLEC